MSAVFMALLYAFLFTKAVHSQKKRKITWLLKILLFVIIQNMELEGFRELGLGEESIRALKEKY